MIRHSGGDMYPVGITHARVFKFFKEVQHQRLSDAGIRYEFLEEIGASSQDVKTLITADIQGPDLKHFPNLKAVIVPFAAINQLDLTALKAKNIRVFNTSAHAIFVAERALVLTLAVLGKIVYFHKLLAKGDWAGRVEGNGFGKEWTSLFGKKVAIYGYGSIGKALHNLLKPFNVELGILHYKDRAYEGVMTFDTLETLADWSDVFIVTAPLNDATRGRINRRTLNVLKGSVLVNVGRGPIIDEAALYDALAQNGLKGFGCDVWYEYPTLEKPICSPSKYPIEAFPHVVMTPHNGGSTQSADSMKYLDVAEQLAMIAKGNYSRQVF